MPESVAASNELRIKGDRYVENYDHIGAVFSGFLCHLGSTHARLPDEPCSGMRTRVSNAVFGLHEKRHTTRLPTFFTQKGSLPENAARVLWNLFGQRQHVSFATAPEICSQIFRQNYSQHCQAFSMQVDCHISLEQNRTLRWEIFVANQKGTKGRCS